MEIRTEPPEAVWRVHLLQAKSPSFGSSVHAALQGHEKALLRDGDSNEDFSPISLVPDVAK